MDWNQFLKDYIGVFGTMFGGITTFIGQNIVKNYFGKLNIYPYDIQLYMFNPDGAGGLAKEYKLSDATSGRLEFHIYFYNSKMIPIAIRDIHLEIGKNKRPVKYKDSLESKAKDLFYLNISPKQLVHYQFSVVLYREDLFAIKDNNGQLFLKALNHDNKSIKYKIYGIVIE